MPPFITVAGMVKAPVGQTPPAFFTSTLVPLVTVYSKPPTVNCAFTILTLRISKRLRNIFCKFFGVIIFCFKLFIYNLFFSRMSLWVVPAIVCFYYIFLVQIYTYILDIFYFILFIYCDTCS